MSILRSTNRYLVVLKGEDVPRVFLEEGPAREFFEKNKIIVAEFVHENLVSQFDRYFVWRQERLYPKN
ncbi:MAG: hypothetical protein ACLQNE_28255 [Thermoguttaceae bacterium]